MIDKSKYSKIRSPRRTEERNLRVYFLIVCEGEKTEPNYFKGIGKRLPPHTLSIIKMDVEGAGKNTRSLVNEAVRMKNNAAVKYDRVWVVFDKDSFPDKDFDNAIHQARSKNIKCAWSNEAFELWYVLHFQTISHAMPREDYKQFIEKELKKRGLKDFRYAKNASDMFDILERYGDRNEAAKRANKLLSGHADENSFAKMNPCTCVYQLVEEIFHPEEIR